MEFQSQKFCFYKRFMFSNGIYAEWKWKVLKWEIRMCVKWAEQFFHVNCSFLITPVVFVRFTFWMFGCLFALRRWFRLRLIGLWNTIAATVGISSKTITIEIIPWVALLNVKLMNWKRITNKKSSTRLLFAVEKLAFYSIDSKYLRLCLLFENDELYRMDTFPIWFQGAVFHILPNVFGYDFLKWYDTYCMDTQPFFRSLAILYSWLTMKIIKIK